MADPRQADRLATTRSRRWLSLRFLSALVPVAVFSLAAWALHRELRVLGPGEIRAAIAAVPLSRLGLAVAATAVSLASVTFYDVLAMRFVGRRMAYRLVAPVSLTATSISNTTGFNALTGGSIRYRFYSRQGVPPLDIYRIIAFCSLTFWLGYALLAGCLLACGRQTLPQALGEAVHWPRLTGLGLLALVALYVTLCWRGKPIGLLRWRLEPPRTAIAALQILVGSLDWLLAAVVFLLLLPRDANIAFDAVLLVFLAAHLAGVASTVPGGLGVFEMTVTYAFGPRLGAATVFATLLAYRLVYYLVPFAAGTIMLAIKELHDRRALLVGVGRAMGPRLAAIAPPFYAAVCTLGGLLLLVSGATPSVEARLRLLLRVLPLPVIEMSSFLASCAGAVLLVLGAGLWRRLDGAYLLALAMLAGGSVFSLLKAFDYEEASVLLVIALLLLPCRRYFYRRASLLSQPFTWPWALAVLLAASGFVWLGLLAHRHVEYSYDLWWRFSLNEHAPRYLRAAAGVAVVLLVAGLRLALRPARPSVQRPTPDDMTAVQHILASAARVDGNLALLGDKSLLFDSDRKSFVMYGVSGRSWIAMGDPVGPAAGVRDVAWSFRELVDRHAGHTVFYEVGTDYLPVYLEMGLSLFKIGEDASVALQGFDLEGSRFKKFRATISRFERDGFRFAVLSPAESETALPELARVSAAWLSNKRSREKGFSLGFFSPDYIRHFPVAVILRGTEIVAFANIWLTGQRQELSVDLMRYVPGVADGLMDALLAHVCLWGREQGYACFSLGMAPLSGLNDQTLAPFWSRMGAQVFRHGEHFYNFQGLRQYKEKFYPEWKPRYLAVSWGLAMPSILLAITTLVSRGPGNAAGGRASSRAS
ncbi:MAG: bifunctional lysylphosphatidylglycerol flippase/synthetase MprF [Kiritimatiellae bacterium]|nr:bifunctional lysylphosphatidylglycerol flippase/synthetase MprF [Kiritimatiellia bacterium]